MNSGTCCALSVTLRSAVLLCPQLFHPPGVSAPQFFSSCLSFPLPVSFGAGEEWKCLFGGPCASLIRRVKVSLCSRAGVWLLWEDTKPSITRPADDLTHDTHCSCPAAPHPLMYSDTPHGFARISAQIVHQQCRCKDSKKGSVQPAPLCVQPEYL